MKLDRELLPLRKDGNLLDAGGRLFCSRAIAFAAMLADPEMIRRHPFAVPFSLLGAYNYPILIHVKSVTGYSVATPRDQMYVNVVPNLNTGIFSPDQVAGITKEHPEVRFITLESVEPLKITLSSRHGPPIDLTPYIPNL